MTRDQLIQKLRAFVCSRPRFEQGNYATMTDYRHDYRRSLRDRDDALKLLDYIAWHDESYPIETIKQALNGRLTLNKNNDLEYCTGQYYPTEYRGAVVDLCRGMIRSAIWSENEPFKTSVYREFDKCFANRVFL